MNLWHLFGRRLRRVFPARSGPVRVASTRRNPLRFRPTLLALEDRTVPAGADLFADATVLTGDYATDTGSNVGATAEVGEPLHDPQDTVTNSVWWRWTAAGDGPVEINTFGSALDTILAVYTGSSVDQLTLVAQDDDAGSPQSQVVFDAVAGMTYSIAVDGYADATGDITLHLGTTPANDNFASAAVVAGGTVTGDNLAATGEAGEPLHSDDPGPVNSVWWQWTATADGPTEINTLGSDFDTVLAVYTGSSVGSLKAVAANDDAGDGSLQSEVIFDAVAGTTYSIAVDGYLNVTGGIVLNLPAAPDSGNQPPVIDDPTFSLDENSVGGTVVGTIAASDPDAGQSLTYSITAGNTDNAFSIDAHTGLIQVQNGAVMDFETHPSFTLTVQVADNGSPPLSSSATVTVNLNDVNEVPTFGSAGPLTVNQHVPTGIPVGTVTATDPDAGQTLAYSLVGGNTGGAFAIDPATGQITVANPAAVDYATNPTFTLSVRATDNGSPSLSATTTVTIAVQNTNTAPVIANQGFAVNEDMPAGTAVGTVAASDPDAGQTLTYAITGGNTGGAFAIDASTGKITVANPAAVDFETNPKFTLTVRVTDNGSPSLAASATVTIALNDVNDAPVLNGSAAMSLGSVNQGDANNPGTHVSDILASSGGNPITDPDAGALRGIAVVAADTSHGSWQFSTDAGRTWAALGSVSATSARLLATDALLRFVPAAGYAGTVAQAITFKAWDQTSGTNGGTANASVCGGTTAFSTANATASIAVRPVASPSQLLDGLNSVVQSLTGPGGLNNGASTSLTSFLTNARRMIGSGNTSGAVAQLRSFENRVAVSVRDGSLTQAQGNDLIARADALIALLQS